MYVLYSPSEMCKSFIIISYLFNTKAMPWTNTYILSIEPLRTTFSKNVIQKYIFSAIKFIWKWYLQNVDYFVQASNSALPNAAYMRQWIRSALV